VHPRVALARARELQSAGRPRAGAATLAPGPPRPQNRQSDRVAWFGGVAASLPAARGPAAPEAR